jgi:ankyrin repeat protein
MHASLQKHLGVVKCLLKASADVLAVNNSGFSVLMVGVQSQSTAVVQLLLKSGANVYAATFGGHSALFVTAREGDVTMMQLLVNSGLHTHTVDCEGHTLLMEAASSGHRPAAEWLLQQGVAVNAVRDDGGTALHSACANNCSDSPAVIELPLAKGADVNKSTRDGVTPLGLAVAYGSLQCVKAPIAGGADVNLAHIDGQTSLHLAVCCKQAAVAQLLLERGATAMMDSVLPLVCLNGDQCCDELTAQMMRTNAETVKILLAAGADVHVRTEKGDTCLHAAARHEASAPVMCLLIKAGIDLGAVNSVGKTTAQLAHDGGHTLIEQLLSRAAQQQH